MSVAPGQHLGVYEVLSALGAGGMGEVYRARDTKLNRVVALKVLPADFLSDPDRLARFKREAQVLASLNHPNIASIYGFEDSSGVPALVLELVEGPTLADKLAQVSTMKSQGSGLPVEDVIAIARQICDALEAAHGQGIVHRDLKPANIKLRADDTVKVLDFGLAKALDPGLALASDVTASPTITSPAMTRMGVILGTAAYMSPEQARGRVADTRADIWAFGCVVYEMLTGQRAFAGSEISDTLAAVLRDEPKWQELPGDTPAPIARLLRRCLAKDLRQRLSAIGDARLELDERDERGTGFVNLPAGRPTKWIIAATTVGLVLGAVVMFIVFSLTRVAPRPTTSRVTLLSADTAAPHLDSGSLAISPDGQAVVFVAGTTPTQLWIRRLDALAPQVLPDTANADLPFWSPDSRDIAFFADGKLKRIAATGGRTQDICEARDGRGGAWNRAGVIVFAPANAGPLMRVPASGGMPQPVTTLDVERGESAHRFPAFLPDGEHFAYAVLPPHAGVYDISVGSLSGTEREHLLVAESAVVFAEPGYLLFERGGGLVAHRFDANRRTLISDAVPLDDLPGGVGENRSAVPAVSVSSNGTMVYLSDPAVNTRLVVFDQSGHEAGQVNVPAGRYVGVSVSRDGRRAVLHRTMSPNNAALWMIDLERGGTTRFANAPGLNLFAVWSPDGHRVAFASDRDGPQNLFVKSAADAAAEEPLFRSKALFKQPQSWSPDGRFIVFTEYSPATNQDLWVVPTTAGTGQPQAYAQTPANEFGGRISPDGRWMLYISDDTGRNEAYVQSFPKPGRKFQATVNGAAAAWWRDDGKQLLIANADLTAILVADVQGGDQFSASIPRVVGRPPRGVVVSTSGVALDVTPDFRRLVTLVPERTDKVSIAMVQNWAPAGR